MMLSDVFFFMGFWMVIADQEMHVTCSSLRNVIWCYFCQCLMVADGFHFYPDADLIKLLFWRCKCSLYSFHNKLTLLC